MIRDSKRRHKRKSVSISEGGVRIIQIALRSTTKNYWRKRAEKRLEAEAKGNAGSTE